MRKRKKTVLTNNREIYEKFNLLNFSTEVLIRGAKQVQINRIIKNVNKNRKILSYEVVGKYIVVKKHSPLNFNIYLKQ